jgi:hypothetical protein
MMKNYIPVLLLTSVCLTGCTAAALRRESTGVSVSVGDLYQQEVLDNLAKFVVNYNAFPSFAYANQGSASITDEGSLTVAPTWVQQGMNMLGVTGVGSRNIQDSYTLTPVNDPRKLELMKCAYQRALISCGYGPGQESLTCPDCEATFNRFYTGDAKTKVADQLSGEVTSECLRAPFCWLCTGPKKCVPKGCCCVGRYCKTYVWVLPEGQEYLTNLTIAILDYALNSAPTQATKQVTYYLDENGIPTTQKLAVGQVSSTVPVDEDPISLLNTPAAAEAQLNMQVQQQIRQYQAEIKALEDKGGTLTEAEKIKYRHLLREAESLQGKLDYLDHQLKTGGLKTQYYRSAPRPEGAPELLQLRQYLNTIPPSPLTR